jgi:hypothetical protein
MPDDPRPPGSEVGPVTPRATSFDQATARTAAVNVAILSMILRPIEPMSERDFDAAVVALAVILAQAERRAGGRP